MSNKPVSKKAAKKKVARKGIKKKAPAKSAAMSSTSPQAEAAIARRYLELLERRRGLGSKKLRSLAVVQKEIDAAKADEESAPSAMIRMEKAHLVTELQQEISVIHDSSTFELSEAEFIEIAASWAERKGYSSASLKRFGVSAKVIQKAGLS